MNKRPTPESDKAKIAFTSLFANDDAYWIPYVVGIKLENERNEAREQLAAERALADRLASQLEPLLIATWREKPPTKAELAFYAWEEARSK
jgi:hypothetical protein